MQKISNAELTKEEIEELRKLDAKTYFKSSLTFLSEHNGFRPGLLHMILGITSGGKSTLRSSIIFDFVSNNPDKKVFLWLSEETTESFFRVIANNSYINRFMKNVNVYSEVDNKVQRESQEWMLEELEEIYIKSEADLFIIDNLTTSKLYGRGFEQEKEGTLRIKEIFAGTDTALLILAHTGSAVKQSHKGIIDSNDIRGGRDIVNLTEFFYVLQNIHINNDIFSTIRITKHRDQDIKNRLFSLSYNSQKRIYDKDFPKSFEDFKRLYRAQNKL